MKGEIDNFYNVCSSQQEKMFDTENIEVEDNLQNSCKKLMAVPVVVVVVVVVVPRLCLHTP